MYTESEFPSNWQLEVNPPWEKVEALRNHLRLYNRQVGHVDEGTNLAIFLRDGEKNLIGGVSAWLWGTSLEINFLWLADNLRGQGIGQRLMAQIEKAGIERGAKQATLSTYSFQAPDFYQRLGYEIFGTIEGLGYGHQKLYLRKNL